MRGFHVKLYQRTMEIFIIFSHFVIECNWLVFNKVFCLLQLALHIVMILPGICFLNKNICKGIEESFDLLSRLQLAQHLIQHLSVHVCPVDPYKWWSYLTTKATADDVFLNRSSGVVVVKCLACRARVLGFDSRSRRYNSEVGYLLLPSCDMAEISLKRCKSSTTSQPTCSW